MSTLPKTRHLTILSGILFGLLLATSSPAQQADSAYELMIDGVKVIVQPSGNQIVEIRTCIRGGVQNYSAAKAGIENLAFTALTECGTSKDDKNSFKNKLDKLGAQLTGGNGLDYAWLTMNCIQSDFDLVWPLYVDALTSPRFDPKEFLRMRQDAIDNLKAQASQPDYAINKLAKETAFAGRSYAIPPEGTPSSIAELTVTETKAYYTSILTRSRMLIVVVGELEKTQLEQRIKAMLETIPRGKPFSPQRGTYMAERNSLKTEKKDLATNYLQGVTGAPAPGTADFNAFLLASKIFYDRQFLEIRTNNGLSYAPYTFLDASLTPSFNIDVSTTQPDAYIGLMDKLISKTKKEGFTPEEINNIKVTYLTEFFYRQETNTNRAANLVVNELIHKDWRRAIHIADDMKKLSVEDVNKAFNKYFGKINWVYQGNPTQVTAARFIGNDYPATDSKLMIEKKKQ